MSKSIKQEFYNTDKEESKNSPRNSISIKNEDNFWDNDNNSLKNAGNSNYSIKENDMSLSYNDFNNSNTLKNNLLGIKREKFENQNKYKKRKNLNSLNHNSQFYVSNKQKYISNQNYNKNYQNKNYNNNHKNHETQKLPIYTVQNKILNELKENRVIIISGNTGCGKSTQVPQFIYGINAENKILMTQPRRIAAVSIAKRLAEEMSENLGEKIGYHVSMNHSFGDKTKIFVKTTGIFLEELIHNNLEYSHIIIDEVHERDIFVDLVLALIKWFFEKNENSKIKLILMSATIAEESFAKYLKDTNFNQKVPIIKILEEWHTVYEFNLNQILNFIKTDEKISKEIKNEITKVVYSLYGQNKNIPEFMSDLFPVVAAILEKIENENPFNKKGVLIFIPGLAEIQDLQNYLENYFLQKTFLEFLILHSQMSDEEQDRVFKIDNKKRKIILATNIAESSITISNIDFVIDFCLVKQTRYDEYQNTSVLELKWCSKANCQQRKGRTGRVNDGYYFKLVTENLYNSFDFHPKAEILRSPLETSILKLKIYDQYKEPNEILKKTIEPPNEEKIINTIFRLEKMGALIKGKQINFENKNIYKSGIITKIGKIFAELPIDIKYSRLIMIAYALGEIDLGITLAAIISQDKSMFLGSDKVNRLNLYKSKNHFGYGKECDFTACYIAYKKWLYEFGKELINKNVKFDTRLKSVNKKKYFELQKDAKEKGLDLRVLKEIIKVENDLKKRLTKFKLYSTNFTSYSNPENLINLKEDKTSFLLKIIIGGTFYNQIFYPEYDDTRFIEEEILASINDEAPKDEKLNELQTIRILNIKKEDAKKMLEIIECAINPEGQIVLESYDENSQIYKLTFDNINAVKIVLFITSIALRRNNEIPIFQYIKKNKYTEPNEQNSLGTKDENYVQIKLTKEPEYLYRVHYYDEYLKVNVNPDKDSVNLIQILPTLEELKKCKLVTDSYNNKSGKSFKKFARYSTVLPKIENIDKFIMLIFAPKFEMMGYPEKGYGQKYKKYEKYIAFQSYEFIGSNSFSKYDENDKNYSFEQALKINLEYVITNYHLKIINEIRVDINEMMKYRFSMINDNENIQNINYIEDEDIKDELTKDEFNQLYKEYKIKTKKIVDKISDLIINTKKYKNITDEKYQELFNYIEKVNHSKSIFDKYNIKNENIENNLLYEEEELGFKNEKIYDNNNETHEYTGYINAIEALKNKVQPDDFLQIHNPLHLIDEFNFTDGNYENNLSIRDTKIKKIYKNFIEILQKISSLCNSNNSWLICQKCNQEINCIKEDMPQPVENQPGIYKIGGAWVNESFKMVYYIGANSKKKLKKNPQFKLEDLEEFEKKLKNDKIEYDNIFLCPSQKHIIGYCVKVGENKEEERRIYYGSDLCVKYPDLSYELLDKSDYENKFEDVLKKTEDILAEKNTEEFKEKITCKLCDFRIKNDLKEFREHLRSKQHNEKLNELRKEFI